MSGPHTLPEGRAQMLQRRADAAFLTQNTSTLFRLPAELRAKILSQAVVREEPMDVRLVELPPLLGTCGALRAEGIPIFYGRDRVVIKTGKRGRRSDRDMDHQHGLLLALAATGESSVRAMRKLRVVWSAGWVDVSPRSPWTGVLDLDVTFSEDNTKLEVEIGDERGYPCFGRESTLDIVGRMGV
ncbi:hypothetical protein LTR85_006695 [Meristemomyces frigidus]|nr:hypothetical protein LTR85_006695 [Meristemomyces frigidus]